MCLWTFSVFSSILNVAVGAYLFFIALVIISLHVSVYAVLEHECHSSFLLYISWSSATTLLGNFFKHGALHGEHNKRCICRWPVEFNCSVFACLVLYCVWCAVSLMATRFYVALHRVAIELLLLLCIAPAPDHELRNKSLSDRNSCASTKRCIGSSSNFLSQSSASVYTIASHP